MGAVRRRLASFKYVQGAMPGFCEDPLFMQEAVANRAAALKYASLPLRKSRDLVLLALQQDGSMLRYVAGHFEMMLRFCELLPRGIRPLYVTRPLIWFSTVFLALLPHVLPPTHS